MQLLVKSRRGVEAGNGVCSPHIIISIFTPGDDPPKVVQNKNTRQVIQFSFDDLDRQPGIATQRALGLPVLFGDEEAEEIATKVKFWHKKGVNFVVCHCDAGVSRSAGVAAALSNYYNGDDSEFFHIRNSVYINPHGYRPNMLVYRKVLNALNGTPPPSQESP